MPPTRHCPDIKLARRNLVENIVDNPSHGTNCAMLPLYKRYVSGEIGLRVGCFQWVYIFTCAPCMGSVGSYSDCQMLESTITSSVVGCSVDIENHTSVPT